VFSRYVALGDSFTEGVGDPYPPSPNGLRGWAGRVAVALAQTNPGLRYANLAVRGRRMNEILDEQIHTGAVVLAFTAADLGTVPLFRRLRGRAARALQRVPRRAAMGLVRDLRANVRWTAAFAAPYVAKRVRLAKRGAGMDPKLTMLTRCSNPVVDGRSRPAPHPRPPRR
jgi:lysophospholipase L1-like esterase